MRQSRPLLNTRSRGSTRKVKQIHDHGQDQVNMTHCVIMPESYDAVRYMRVCIEGWMPLDILPN